MSFFGSKKTVADVWPLRNKRCLVLVDPKMINAEGTNSMSTIEKLQSQGAKVIVITSFGDVIGVPLKLPDSNRQMMVDAFQKEEGYAYTNFFSNLPGKEKLAILQKVKSGVPKNCNANRFTGKTHHFATLEVAEKKELVTAYTKEKKLGVSFRCMTARPVYESIKSALPKVDVKFEADPIKFIPTEMKAGDIVVLENLRFYAAENSPRAEDRMEFAHVLAFYGDVFINDAFNISYSQLASTTSLPRLLRHAACGYLIEKELKYFGKLLTCPARPLCVAVGGARIAEKLSLIQALLSKVDKVLVGGQLAIPFLQAVGVTVGRSAVAESFVQEASEILQHAGRLNVRIVLPTDHMIAESLDSSRPTATQSSSVPSDMFIVDAGPNTLYAFGRELRSCRSIFWTGPLGVMVGDKQSDATHHFARTLVQANLMSVVGGRHTCAAVTEAGVAADVSHMCSGGIACLEVLRGNALPGIEAISDAIVELDTTAASSVSDLLRKLPLFSGCTSHDLNLVSRKAVRRSHAMGDVIIYDGDRRLSMWVVTKGSVVVWPREECGKSVAQRTITSGGAIGQYEFLTNHLAAGTAVAAEPDTVTYQITTNALHEVINESPDFATQMVSNLSEPLRALAMREQKAASSEMAVLESDLKRMRVPVPASYGSWLHDTVSTTLTSFMLSLFSMYVTPTDGADTFLAKSVPAAAMMSGHEAVRTATYHTMVQSPGASPFVAAIAAAGLSIPVKLMTSGRMAEAMTPKSVLNYGLTAAAVALAPAVSHGLFLTTRSHMEVAAGRLSGRHQCFSQANNLMLTLVCRVVTGLLFFPIATRDSNLQFGTVQYTRHLLLFLAKQVMALVFQLFSRSVTKQFIA